MCYQSLRKGFPNIKIFEYPFTMALDSSDRTLVMMISTPYLPLRPIFGTTMGQSSGPSTSQRGVAMGFWRSIWRLFMSQLVGLIQAIHPNRLLV
jgi:hypothetical protein